MVPSIVARGVDNGPIVRCSQLGCQFSAMEDGAFSVFSGVGYSNVQALVVHRVLSRRLKFILWGTQNHHTIP